MRYHEASAPRDTYNSCSCLPIDDDLERRWFLAWKLVCLKCSRPFSRWPSRFRPAAAPRMSGASHQVENSRHPDRSMAAGRPGIGHLASSAADAPRGAGCSGRRACRRGSSDRSPEGIRILLAVDTRPDPAAGAAMSSSMPRASCLRERGLERQDVRDWPVVPGPVESVGRPRNARALPSTAGSTAMVPCARVTVRLPLTARSSAGALRRRRPADAPSRGR
jgi:hypothetical protein